MLEGARIDAEWSLSWSAGACSLKMLVVKLDPGRCSETKSDVKEFLWLVLLGELLNCRLSKVSS